MKQVTSKFSVRYNTIFAIVVVFQFAVYLAIALNVPIVRPVLATVFYTFVPGFLLVLLLRVEGDIIWKVICSVALSLIFLMLVGLVVDQTLYCFGFTQPLSTLSVLNVFTMINLMICGLNMLRYRTRAVYVTLPRRVANLRPYVFLSTLPLLGFLGANQVNAGAGNILSLTLVFTSAATFAYVCIKQRKNKNLLAFTLFCVSLGYLELFSLRSSYLIGVDAMYEYFTFSFTNANKHWNFGEMPILYNSALSITILPTILSSLAGISGELIFKVIFQAIFSLLPVTLYMFYRDHYGDVKGFLASVIFVGTSLYVTMPSMLKQELSLLFFAGAFYLLLKRPRNRKDAILATLFGAGIIVSHYSTATLFIAFLTVFIAIEIYRIFKPETPHYSAAYVMLMFVLFVSWALYVTSTVFTGLTTVLDRVVTLFFAGTSEFLKPYEFVTFPEQSLPQLPYIISLYGTMIGFLVKVLIIFGAVKVALLPGLKLLKRNSANSEVELTCINIAALILLTGSLFFPSIATTIFPARIFQIALVFLAPAVVVGISSVFQLVRRVSACLSFHIDIDTERRRILEGSLALLIILSYFVVASDALLVLTGGTSTNLIFQNYGEYYNRFYVHDEEVQAAKWMAQYIESAFVYADNYARMRVIAFGHFVDHNLYESEVGTKYPFPRQVLIFYYSLLDDPVNPLGLENMIRYKVNYIYLGYNNVVNGKFHYLHSLPGSYYTIYSIDIHDVPNMDYLLSKKNLIYNNGASQIRS